MQQYSEEELLRELESVKAQMNDIHTAMEPIKKELSDSYGKVLRQQSVDYSRRELPDEMLAISRRLDESTAAYLLLDRRRIEILRELERRGQ